MPIRIQVATTSKQLSDVYHLRYQVYVEDGGYIEPNDQQIVMDMYDAIPDCTNIIAYKDDLPIGTIRLNRDSAIKLPAESLYDFSDYRQQISQQAKENNEPTPVVISAGMLAIDHSFRHRRDVFRALFKMSCDVGYSWGATHIIVTVNHETETIYKRLGFEALARDVWYEKVSDYVVPMVCELGKIYRWAFGVLKGNRGLLDAFSGCFEYVLISSGQVIFKEGESGHEAYLISSGAVTISRANIKNDETLDLATLSSGALFGELSLIDDEPRSANAVALSNCELVVLSRESFWQKAREDAEYLKSLLMILSQRLRDVDQRAFVYAHGSVEERLQFFLDKVEQSAVMSVKMPGRRVAKMTLENFSFMASTELDETKLFLENLQQKGDIDITDKTIVFLR